VSHLIIERSASHNRRKAAAAAAAAVMVVMVMVVVVMVVRCGQWRLAAAEPRGADLHLLID